MKSTPLPSVKEVLQPVQKAINVGGRVNFTTIITQDRNQAYTSLVEEINKALFDNCDNYADGTHYCNGYEQACADILENVVKPLYNKTGITRLHPISK